MWHTDLRNTVKLSGEVDRKADKQKQTIFLYIRVKHDCGPYRAGQLNLRYITEHTNKCISINYIDIPCILHSYAYVGLLLIYSLISLLT
jgi:hypothetical protein